MTIEAAKAFFGELGLESEGETTVESPRSTVIIGLQNVRATLAQMRTPDGHGRIELDKFHRPETVRAGLGNVLVDALGIRSIVSTVDGSGGAAHLRAHRAEPVGDVVQNGDTLGPPTVVAPSGSSLD